MTQAGIPASDLIDMLWAKTEPTCFLTREQFVAGLDGWHINGVLMDGEIAYITAQSGPDFHFQSMGTAHRLTRKMINDFLAPIIAAHGYAATKTPWDDHRQNRFNRLFGFEAVGVDNYDIYYRIERLR